MYDMYSAQGGRPAVQYVRCLPKGGVPLYNMDSVQGGGSQCTIRTVPKGRVPMYEEEEEETWLNPARITFPMVPTGPSPGTPLFRGLRWGMLVSLWT